VSIVVEVGVYSFLARYRDYSCHFFWCIHDNYGKHQPIDFKFCTCLYYYI